MKVGTRDREVGTERIICATSVCALLAIKTDILFAAEAEADVESFA